MKYSIIISILIVVIGIVYIGRQCKSKESDNNNNKTVVTPKTEIYTDIRKIDIGVIPLDSVWKGEVVIKNVGKNNLIIYETITSCGCVRAKCSPRPVLPDSVCRLKINVHPQNEGLFVQRIGIACNVEKSPILFSIQGRARKIE